MKRPPRVFIVAVLATGLFVLATGPAIAALFLVFETDHIAGDRSTGLVGPGTQSARKRVAGEPWLRSKGCLSSMRLHPLLIRSRLSPLAELRMLRGMVQVGTLVADRHGTGRISFDAPNASGTYELVAYCPKCQPFSAGRNVVPMGNLRVARAGALPNTGASPTYALALILILVSCFLLFLRRGRSA